MNYSISDWNGYKKLDFSVGDRESFIVCPKKPLHGNPWVWRTEFFGAFDYADRALLDRGWHLAYHCASDMYGCPDSVAMMREFYDVLISDFRMDAHPALFGFSRGGLYAVNFALAYPDCVGVLYLDAPVLDIRSWPGGKGTGSGTPSCWEECKNWYHLTEETAPDFCDNPLDHAEKIAATQIPVLLVCGAVDSLVPYSENGEPFYKRVKAAGGIIEQIVKPDCDHHPHSLSEPSPIVDFIENAILSDKTGCFKHIIMNAIGDSITYGTYTGPNDTYPASFAKKPWCVLVAEKMGFKQINNYGSNGTSISSTSTILSESAFSLRFKDMVDEANLIIVAGGSNDFGTSVKLGNINDSTDISFYGGLRVLCEGLKNKYPSATVVFITPIYRSDKLINDNGNTLDEYRQAIMDIAGGIYGFSVIDGGSFGFDKTADTYLLDGVHPIPDGHIAFAEKVVKELKEILENR